MSSQNELRSTDFTVFATYEFKLTQGYNKFTFDECSSWPNLSKGTIAMVSLALSGAPSASIALNEHNDSSDYEITTFANGSVALSPLSASSNKSISFQVIAFVQPINVTSILNLCLF